MAAKWIQSISHEFTFTPDVTVDRLLYALACIRKFDKSDKNLEVFENGQADDHQLNYNLNYIVPDFMKLLFKMSNLAMCETIDYKHKDNATGDLVTSMITRKGHHDTMNLETWTRYCRPGPGQPLKAITKVTITLPFQIPDILHPPLKMWTLNKTKTVRALETKYLAEQAMSTTL